MISILYLYFVVVDPLVVCCSTKLVVCFVLSFGMLFGGGRLVTSGSLSLILHLLFSLGSRKQLERNIRNKTNFLMEGLGGDVSCLNRISIVETSR